MEWILSNTARMELKRTASLARVLSYLLIICYFRVCFTNRTKINKKQITVAVTVVIAVQGDGGGGGVKG